MLVGNDFVDLVRLIMREPDLDVFIEFILHQKNVGEIHRSTTLLLTPVPSISYPLVFKLFLVLQNVVQTANMGQNLDDKLIATVQGKLGVAAPANTSGRAGDTTERQVRFTERYAVSLTERAYDLEVAQLTSEFREGVWYPESTS